MTEARLIDGRAIAAEVRREVALRASGLRERGVVPRLGIVLAGESVPSKVYVRSKERAGREVGVEVEVARFSEDVAMDTLSEAVRNWNVDDSVHGMIVQLPLPRDLDASHLLDVLDPAKDVDGLTATSLGRLMSGRRGFRPATPLGIVELLRRSGISPVGRRVVVIGRSELVGKPLVNMLLLRGADGDATVTVCHSRTPRLTEICRRAEILVVAAGRPQLVTAEMVSDGATVVDVGINRVDGRLVGDVAFDDVKRKAGAITPVPGGVGPMTVAMLLVNTITAAEMRSDRA